MANIESGISQEVKGHGSSPNNDNDNKQSPPAISASEVLYDVPLIFPGSSDVSRDIQAHISSRCLGVFDRLIVIHRVEEPKQYERKIKWFITFLVAGVAVIDALSSFTFWRMASIRFSVKLTKHIYSCSSSALYRS